MTARKTKTSSASAEGPGHKLFKVSAKPINTLMSFTWPATATPGLVRSRPFRREPLDPAAGRVAALASVARDQTRLLQAFGPHETTAQQGRSGPARNAGPA
jgi:hypothetical protein